MATALTTYLPFDAGAGADVTESGWRDMARHWLATGVIDDVDSEFAVSQRAAGANLSVDVASGACWIRGHYGAQSSTVNLAIATADATNPRIDRVILRADFVDNVIELDVLTGTPAGSPSAPALTQNSSQWEISLAQVSVPATDTTISTGQITDERTLVGTATYVPKASDSTEIVSSSAMRAYTGSPSLLAASSAYDVGWMLDAAAVEGVAGHPTIPAWWTTVDIYLWWTNAGAGSGNVVLRSIRSTHTDGAASNANADTNVTVAAPAQNVLKRTQLRAGAAASTLQGISVERVANDAADTLANDIAVVRVEIVRAS